MQSRRGILIFLVVVLGVMALGAGVRQALLANPTITIDENTVYSAEPITVTDTRDDIVLMSQQGITLSSDSHITGHATLISFSDAAVTIDGRIDGDVIIFASNVVLGPNSDLRGKLDLVGGNVVLQGSATGRVQANVATLNIAETATFSGEVTMCAPTETQINDQRDVPLELAPCPEINTDAFVRDSLIFSAITSVVMLGLSALAVASYPRRIAIIEDVIQRKRWRSFFVGLAIWALVIGGAVLVMVGFAIVEPLGIVLLFAYLLLLLIVFIMGCAGWITLSMMFGAWLTSRFSGQPIPPMVVAFFGTVILSLVFTISSFIPYLDIVFTVVWFAMSALGMGATYLMWFGRRSQRRNYFVQG
jgi:Polymer-forming cytoskeletal